MGPVLVIGIDAATLDLIEPYVAAGRLPHIGRLLREGAYAPLRSTLPVMSPPAWTSMITGQNPGKHGIYDFIRFRPGSYRIEVTRSDQTSYRTIFDLATQYGRRVLAINVPLTYPPRPINGVMVAGPITPSSGIFTHPPELAAELRAQGYYADTNLKYEPGHDAAYIADSKAVARSQAHALIRLMRREPWDLAMVVLRGVDEAMGYLWHHMDPQHPRHDPVAAQQFGDAILDIHRDIDNLVGLMVAAAGPDATVMIVSDHGSGPCYKEVFLNVWLEQQSWLVRKPAMLLNKGRKTLLRRLGLTRENLAPKLDWPLARAIRSRIPERIQHAIIPEQSVTLADVVDWSRTRAYSMGNIGQIYVNLKGREPQGIVEPGRERDRLLDEISEALYRLTDEGQPLVDQIHRSEDIYHGPYAAHGPDLNILMRGMTYVSQSWREMAGSAIFGPSGYSGTHRPLGLVALHGRAIAAGRQPEAQIVDVAPTLIWLMGLPIPDDLDGQLLAALLRTDSLAQQPPQQIEAAGAPVPQSVSQGWADAAEEQQVLDRLRDLGYLE
ncbi:MAG: alkaline phosphatase family protein [Roseiflexaceae bacterium]